MRLVFAQWHLIFIYYFVLYYDICNLRIYILLNFYFKYYRCVVGAQPISSKPKAQSFYTARAQPIDFYDQTLAHEPSLGHRLSLRSWTYSAVNPDFIDTLSMEWVVLWGNSPTEHHLASGVSFKRINKGSIWSWIMGRSGTHVVERNNDHH